MPINYVSFNDVRVTNNKRTGKIELTIKDSRFPDGFKLTLNSGRKEELALRKILNDQLNLPRPKEAMLPVYIMLPYQRDYNDSEPVDFSTYRLLTTQEALESLKDPERIPLGIGNDENSEHIVYWDVKDDGNLLTEGRVGSGKTTLMNTITDYILRYPDIWDCYVIDKRMEYRAGNQNNSQMHHADTINDIEAMIDKLYNECKLRSRTPKNSHKNILLRIDEMWQFLPQSNDYIPNGEKLSEGAINKLSVILSFGAQYSIYVLTDIYHSQNKYWPASENLELNSIFNMKVDMGSLTNNLRRGRAIIKRFGYEPEEFQTAFHSQ